MKPIIGITANYSYDGTGECADGIGTQGQEWRLLADDYICAICRAGGLPIILPIMDDMEDVKQLLMGVDGVLFPVDTMCNPVIFRNFRQANAAEWYLAGTFRKTSWSNIFFRKQASLYLESAGELKS